ncbi:MAG: hypothetical protein QXQ94_10660 [Candidatus Bathyarchaeia archaeon]
MNFKVLEKLALQMNGLKSWKTAFLLSIIVPLSLLTTFKLTGIIKEPITIAETKELPIKEWSFPRPTSSFYYIDDLLSNTYSDAECLSSFSLTIGTYSNDDVAYNYADIISLIIKINVAVFGKNARIENIYFNVKNDSEKSKVDWLLTEFDLENLSKTSFGFGKTAHISLAGTNNPSWCYFKGSFEWELFTQNNKTHQREITCEIVYYNGSVYKNLIQPFRLIFYAGYHILTFNDAVIVGEGRSVSVNVSVDHVTYETPIIIFVREGVHQISFPPQLELNSTTYQFDGVFYKSEANFLTPNITVNVDEDIIFHVSYRKLEPPVAYP